MDRSSWDARIRRATELSARETSTRQVLDFYEHILRFQQKICQDVSAVPGPERPANTSLREYLRGDKVLEWLPELLDVVQKHGPAKLGKEAELLRTATREAQSRFLSRYLKEEDSLDPASSFLARVLFQPYAEVLARQSKLPATTSASNCPACGSKPQLAVLIPEGDGGKRFLGCSLCFTEWEFRRVLCPSCAEVEYTKLPRYSPENPRAVRVEACDSCHAYLKSFDLTIDGLMVPEVDEIGTVALDLWAAEQEYAKIHLNLMGF
jgi:FdhE protein